MLLRSKLFLGAGSASSLFSLFSSPEITRVGVSPSSYFATFTFSVYSSSTTSPKPPGGSSSRFRFLEAVTGSAMSSMGYHHVYNISEIVKNEIFGEKWWSAGIQCTTYQFNAFGHLRQFCHLCNLHTIMRHWNAALQWVWNIVCNRSRTATEKVCKVDCRRGGQRLHFWRPVPASLVWSRTA